LGLKTCQSKDITELISDNAEKIISLWKWQDNNWAVYLPNQDTKKYADSKGFGVIDSINVGEGFWVNCAGAIILQ